jgi:putative PIN family toxin of toxin-antitoxin system
LFSKGKPAPAFGDEENTESLSFFNEAIVVPTPRSLSVYSVRDPDDAVILSAAIRAKCDVLVTGDPDLLVIAPEVRELSIISPRQFWELQKQGT